MHGFTTVDVFSGAGGMTLGFALDGFRPVLAVEKEADFAATYTENFGAHAIAGDLASPAVQKLLDRRADVVVGGPPCQGFSNLTGNRPDDPRRMLWRAYLDAVERTECRAFVVENVPNFLTSPEGEAFLRAARKMGFEIGPASMGVLTASDYGVPQARKRTFIIGSKVGAIALPEPSDVRRTVRDAFLKGCHRGDAAIPRKPLHLDLPRTPAAGADLHLGRTPTAKSVERYRAVPVGGNRFDLQRNRPDLTPDCWIRKTSGGTDLFGRLRWDRPSVTIRTEFYKPEKGRYLHPEEHRPITHWEAARLQSFPDTFRFHGTKVRIAIQIGNAVPPLLAQAVAKQVSTALAAAKRRGRSKAAANKAAS